MYYRASIAVLSLAILSAGALQGMHKVTRIPQPHRFVLSTLLKAYPELRTPIVVKDNMKDAGFGVAQHVLRDGQEYDLVHVPFNKEELKQAQALKKSDRVISADEMYIKLALAGFASLADDLFKVKKNRMFQKVWESKICTLLEEHGFACRSTTLDVWKGILLHEGAHLLYNDSKDRLPSKKAMRQLRDIKNPSKCKLVGLLERILPAYQQSYLAEYRADQESIKRIQSVDVLRALSVFYQDQEFWNQYFSIGAKKSLSGRIDSLFALHPADCMRAQYFEQAADALEKKLSKKS